MNYQIVNYDPNFIEKQVDLIWEVTDNWKYPIGTSYQSIKDAYSKPKFDPSTRFYAVTNDELIGYVTSAVAENKDKEKYGTLRFPIVKGEDEKIIDDLMNKVFERFSELEIKKVTTSAGEGIGTTPQLAKKYGFEQAELRFTHSNSPISDLKISGEHSNVLTYEPSFESEVKDIIINQLHKGWGDFMYDWASSNKARKDKITSHRTNWNLIKDDKGIAAFSYLHRSDHNPANGDLSPIYVRDQENATDVLNQIISSHVAELQPHGMTNILTYLDNNWKHLEPSYNELGISFDHVYNYVKHL